MRIETTPAGLLITLAAGDYDRACELDDWPGVTLYVTKAGVPVQVQIGNWRTMVEFRQWLDRELGGCLDADTLARRYRLPVEGT